MNCPHCDRLMHGSTCVCGWIVPLPDRAVGARTTAHGRATSAAILAQLKRWVPPRARRAGGWGG